MSLLMLQNLGSEDHDICYDSCLINEYLMRHDFENLLQTSIEHTHFNVSYPQFMNIYVPCKAHGYLYVQNMWQRFNIDDLVKRVVSNIAAQLTKKSDEYGSSYIKDEMSDFIKFYDDQGTQSHENFLSTIHTLFEHRKLVEEYCNVPLPPPLCIEQSV